MRKTGVLSSKLEYAQETAIGASLITLHAGVV